MLKSDHSNESYWAVLSCGVVYYAVQGGSNFFQPVDGIQSATIQMKAPEQYFPVVLLIMLYKVVLAFESVDEIPQCDHSNESYWAVLSCGVVYNAGQGGSSFWVSRCNPKVLPFKWSRPLIRIIDLSWISDHYFSYALHLQGGSRFWVWGWNPKVRPLRWKLLLKSSNVLWYSLLCSVRGGSIVAFESLVSIQQYPRSLWIFF